LAYFDIDNDPFTFDSIVSLFDSVGTLIGLDDDSLRLIRSRGHLPKGEYDGHHDGYEGQADPAQLHG
jgi:hypothetical protein